MAAEANRTMAEAREAVRKTRQARGYYSPESMSGKGMASNSSSNKGFSKGKGSGSSGKGKSGFGPCFICGLRTHGYLNCPDRFSIGKSKGKMKGPPGKGKKGKSKGKNMYSDIHMMNIWTIQWDDIATHGRSHTFAVLDTGATENAVGTDCLHDLIMTGGFSYSVHKDDLPTFRFGNGQRDQAVSRVDLQGTSLGNISFYVLGGTACSTPPLIGARTLREKNAKLSYANGLFIYQDEAGEPNTQRSVKMQPLQSGHLTINLTDNPVDPMVNESNVFFNDKSVIPVEPSIMMVQRDRSLDERLQHLAQRLSRLRGDQEGEDLRSRRVEGEDVQDSSNSMRRSEARGLSVLWPSQECEEQVKPTCSLDDMREMRPPPELCVEGQDGRRLSTDGSRTSPHPVGIGGASTVSATRELRREDCQWQADGNQREDVAAGSFPDHGDPHDLGRVPEEVAASWTSRPSTSELSRSSINPTGGSDNHRSDWLPSQHGDLAGGERKIEETGARTEDVSGCQGQGSISEEGEDRRAQGEFQVLSKCCGCGTNGGFFGRGDCGGGRGYEEAGGTGEEGVNGMWMALRGLQKRMRGDHTHTTMSPRLDVSNASPGDATLEDTTKPLRIHDDVRRHSDKNVISAHTSRQISRQVAALGAMVLMPLQGLMTSMANSIDFMEIACSPFSALSSEMESLGYTIKRVNFKSGFDLDSRQGTRLLDVEMQVSQPRMTWTSLPCTRLSPLQNLCERSEEEWARFYQRQGRDLKRAEEVAESICKNLEAREDADMAWEWPTGAAKGWSSRAIKKILRTIKKTNRVAYWCRFHGCAYGLQFNNLPVQKSWTVLTTNREIWLSLQRKCPGHVDHVHCRGEVAKASSYYPPKMVTAITKSLVASWTKMEKDMDWTLVEDVENYLLEIPKEKDHEERVFQKARDDEPNILALTRTRYPKEAPTGRRLEVIRQQMLRIHRAAGHPSFGNLQRLLRARGAPQWAIDLAGGLQCADCIESKRPLLHPPASIKPTPELYEIVGVDIFEFEREVQEKKVKHKLILWRDRASGYVFVNHLQEYTGAWEPKTRDVLVSLTNWLMVNPCPKWILSDAGTIFTSEEFLNYAGRSGIGVLTAPAEAHWMLGAEEGCINILKSSVKRLLREEPGLQVPEAFSLAVHGHNSTIGPSGFSPFQWVRGGSCPQEDLLEGLNPRKAFEGLLKMKEKARIAYEQEHAKYKLSRLGNSVGRSPMQYQSGSLVMLWRQRMRPGKTTGHWVGPVRVLIQEGTTLWLASGSTILKAKTNQVRGCSRREELQATLEGTAIYKQPVTMETLLKTFTGKHFQNVTGEVPSKRQLQDDVSGATVHRESQPSKLPKSSGERLRKRKNEAAEERPKIRPAPQVEAERKQKEIEAEKDEDAKAENDEEADDENEAEAINGGGAAIPTTELTEALRSRAADRLDGIPMKGPTGNQCTTPQCALPGGHAGPHIDDSGSKFSYSPSTGRVSLEEDSSDDSSTSSEELAKTPRGGKGHREEEKGLFVLEMDVTDADRDYVLRHPHKSAIWLSKKMMEKSKEESWKELPLSRKKDFDEAQARELSNVLQSKALRSLTQEETLQLNPKSVMNMRWVLTTKASGDAKARLVVLGYQQGNVAEAAAASAAPTLGRLSRNMLLAMISCHKLHIRSGDVTSAFLQAEQSLEDQQLTVWAPSELAVLFGADPQNPTMALRVMKAFYGLVQSPRCWFDHITGKLQSFGWQQLLSDKCVFYLKDGDRIVGLAGLHVDDIVLGGDINNSVFNKAQQLLEQSFRWGKWQDKDFVFAGCRIQQMADFSIKVDQQEYSSKWIDEVKLSPQREKEVKSTATPSEVSQLRGLIGSVAWRSSQTSPQFQADANLLLSEVPLATVGTIIRANKLVREMKRTADQVLIFPSWGREWTDLAVVVWADASNSNRPDKSSTMGLVAGLCPKEILDGEEVQVALLSWKSSKTPRQCYRVKWSRSSKHHRGRRSLLSP